MDNSLLINKDLEMQEMKIKFDGKTHLIDANTLINSMIHFTNLIQEINKDISNDTKKLEIKVKALPEGSFIVDFLLQAHDLIGKVKSVFIPDAVPYINELKGAIKEVYDVAKFLLGENPKKVEHDGNKITITKNNGTVNNFQVVGNIYLTNPTIKNIVSKQFETLENDQNITGFELLDNNDKQIIEIDKSDFSDMSNLESELTVNEKIVPETGLLNISSLDWEFKKKWEFYDCERCNK